MDRGRQLLPVPPRAPRSTDVDQAAGHVERLLPDLDPGAARALALVELAARTRVEAAAALAASPDAVGELLARGRKELRRSSFPLSATGWCERAERLLSDRLDGPLDARGAGRVESHLRNCGRCVEHERRLASARVALVEGFLAEHGPREAVPAPAAPEAEIALRAVEPPTERIEVEAAPQEVELEAAPDVEADPVEPEVAPAVEPEPAPEDEPAPRPAAPVLPQPVARDEAAGSARVLPSSGASHAKGAEAGEESLLAALTAGGAWAALTAVAVLLAVISVIVTMLGMVGVDRLF